MTAAEIRRVPDAMGAHKRRNRAALKAWEGVPTRTRSEAYALADGMAVILVEGIDWPFSLELVRRVRTIPFALTEKALLVDGAA